MSAVRGWVSKVLAGLVVATLVIAYYYLLQDPVIFERLEDVETTNTTASGRVIGTKVVGCDPEEAYIIGWGFLAGNKRPVEITRIGATENASGVRSYPLGKADFGRWQWTAPEGLPMDAVATTIRYGGYCRGRTVMIGPMAVVPPTKGIVHLELAPDR